jgi:large subunit ribosomal protein L1
MKNTKLQTKIKLLNEQLELENHHIASVVNKLKKISETCKRKFDESLDLVIGIESNKKNEVIVRGSCDLPQGHGKQIKLLVFAEGQIAEFARKQGADLVGGIDIIDSLKNGEIKTKFHYCIAVESIMPKLMKNAQFLNSKRIMPNTKDGTIIKDNEDVLGAIIKNIKTKTVFFKKDKSGYVRMSVGKISFSINQLTENVNTVLNTIQSFNKNTKNNFLTSVYASTTMGPSIKIHI